MNFLFRLGSHLQDTLLYICTHSIIWKKVWDLIGSNTQASIFDREYSTCISFSTFSAYLRGENGEWLVSWLLFQLATRLSIFSSTHRQCLSSFFYELLPLVLCIFSIEQLLFLLTDLFVLSTTRSKFYILVRLDIQTRKCSLFIL